MKRQKDPFLRMASCIMTQELAQLGERLEKEKFDIRAAVVCYICGMHFTKTAEIWSNMSASQGSPKLALQNLVEKTAALQAATNFSDQCDIFASKVIGYAQLLANSGRTAAAMRYLCLLPDDPSTAVLRDRIYNSAPEQMGQLLRAPPRFPFDVVHVQPLPKAQPAYQPQPGRQQPGMRPQQGMPHGMQPGMQPGMPQQGMQGGGYAPRAP